MTAPWGTQSIQFTWFAGRPVEQDAATFFEKIWQVPPEGTQSQITLEGPLTVALSGGSLSGGQGKFFRRLQVHGGRIDCVIEPVLSSPVEIHSFDSMLSEAGKVLEGVERVAEVLPSVNRLALVGRLMSPAPNLAAATSNFMETLGLGIAVTGASEIAFQMNKPKDLIEGFKINRLVRWSVERFMVFQMPIPAAGGAPQVVAPSEANLCMVNVDLNTTMPPPKPILSSADQDIIFRAMLDELTRFAPDPRPSFL